MFINVKINLLFKYGNTRFFNSNTYTRALNAFKMPMVRSFKFSFSREEGCLLKVVWKLQRGRAWDVKSWEFLVNITKANFLQALAILSTWNAYHCNHVGNRGVYLLLAHGLVKRCERYWCYYIRFSNAYLGISTEL